VARLAEARDEGRADQPGGSADQDPHRDLRESAA
jgi:hypothetical protein